MSSTRPRNPRQKITAEVLNRYSEAQLDKYIQQMGKRANRHLIALEKEDAAKGSKAYAYMRTLAHDNQYVKHTEQPRFRTTTSGETFQQKKAHAAMIQRFIGARTHSVAGVKRAYEKTYNTYIKNKAMAELEKDQGVGNFTKAQLLVKQEELKEKITEADFNGAWGAFNSEQLEKAKVMSEIVADLIEEGYKGADIGKAIDMYGTDQAENEYKDLIDNNFVIKDQMDTEEEPPFEQKGQFD